MKPTTPPLVIHQPSIDERPEFYAPWYLRLGEGEISPRRLALFKAIDVTGSISQAAKSSGMTYKAAWDAVETINNLAQEVIVERQHGGAGGGGARLTAKGKQLLATHEHLQAMQILWMASLHDLDADVLPMMRRLSMMTSARNSLYGKIKVIKDDGVEAQVILALQGEDSLSITITKPSIERMRLRVGKGVWALIKSTWVVLMPHKQAIRTSADNCLCGQIKSLLENELDAEVTLQLNGGNTLTSVITRESSKRLGLHQGMSICALVDSSHIILGSEAHENE
jgi:molybdate transport system regulatory protein